MCVRKEKSGFVLKVMREKKVLLREISGLRMARTVSSSGVFLPNINFLLFGGKKTILQLYEPRKPQV